MRDDAEPSGRDALDLGAVGQTVAHVRGLIERGDLRPGDRLAPERELVRRIGVSRSSIRVGLHTLAAMGVITIRQGAGAFITAGPPTLVSQPLALLTVMHDISLASQYEARQMIEGSAAALAAERATGDQLAAISDEVIGMYSTLAEPRAFFRHDAGFHRAVAAGANNRVLGALIDMVASLHDQQRPATIDSDGAGLLSTADLHRLIYVEIRRRNAEGARAAVAAYFRHAQARQCAECASTAGTSARVS
ncbi:MAG: FCD domain-containing protein [Vicinamibacterales bacterium]|jgi:GntR family transcriptional repressor for pyruvate dehydrogenase complex|nr:FCD domain-containing protein [Vicinamibacterales bacterium]